MRISADFSLAERKGDSHLYSDENIDRSIRRLRRRRLSLLEEARWMLVTFYIPSGNVFTD
jgi:hypothetical protein